MRTLVALAVVAACGRGDKPSTQDPPASTVGTAPGDATGSGSETVREPMKNLTPNEVFARGVPTFVVGTLGDDAADRRIVAQAQLVRSLFPTAAIVPDTSIDLAAGPSAWPPNPVLYGGGHLNAVVAALGDALPLHVDAERIVVGGETYAGAGHTAITVVPAGTNHPAFVLYAGTGTPGVEAHVHHGAEPLLIADEHGRLQTGTWERGADGKVTAKLGARARRIPWRIVERAVAGVPLRVAFPQQLAPAADEAAVVDAVVRGITLATTRLKVAAPPPITTYVYPDRGSKLTLTGDKGDGHATPTGAIHVIRFDPKPGGGLEHLVAHEGTHAITRQQWSPAGSILLGEGLAVWASGRYGGVSLADWQHELRDRPAVATLLPAKGFQAKPEGETYPFGGLLVTVAIELVGFDNVRDHLYAASAETWADACKAAGTTAEAIDAAMAARR